MQSSGKTKKNGKTTSSISSSQRKPLRQRETTIERITHGSRQQKAKTHRDMWKKTTSKEIKPNRDHDKREHSSGSQEEEEQKASFSGVYTWETSSYAFQMPCRPKVARGASGSSRRSEITGMKTRDLSFRRKTRSLPPRSLPTLSVQQEDNVPAIWA